MAENQGVWGIDIGQAGLKAVRLRYAEAANQVVAVAFDYVPHAKILSQPDAVPDELIAQALSTFLSRNDIQGDLIAMSVPGQTALARFIQLPPVEASKVAEIVKYEARQQIPFPLEEVIWDFQPLGGGVEESGFMLDAEVGLFAMKRDQVMQHLRPFTDAKVEVELIQVAPLALYNFLCYDRLGIRPGEETEEAEDYTLVLDMGADNTTLMVSNGTRIWIRNVPLGGNHFTRALTKEMKLTFAKAEHLKCNATKSEDPRAVFQALRPVFNDCVSEIQRSIGYFSSVNREAKIGRILGLGNGFKLAGLQKFLQQNLKYEVERVEAFRALAGDAVLNAPLFQENIMSFAVAYGLGVQALRQTRIRTTLLPPEIKTARMIRKKKPWAVATAAALLAGLALSTVGYAAVMKSVSTNRFGTAEDTVQDLTSTVGTWSSEYSSAESANQTLKQRGDKLTENLRTREDWLEVYKAINECLPRDQADEQDETEIFKQNKMKIVSITASRQGDLSAWFTSLTKADKDWMLPADQEAGPTGAGYVFRLDVVHYHDVDEEGELGTGVGYTQNTILKNLNSWTISHDGKEIPVRQMGISHATIVEVPKIEYFRWKPERPDDGATPIVDITKMAGNGAGLGMANPLYSDPYATASDFLMGDALLGTGGSYNQGGVNKPFGSSVPDDESMGVQAGQFKAIIEFTWQPKPKDQRSETPPGTGQSESAGTEEEAAPLEE